MTAPRKGCHGPLFPRTPPAPSPACLIRLPCTNHDKQPCTACRPRDTGEGSSSTHGQIPCDSYRWSLVSSLCGHLAVRSASPHGRTAHTTGREEPVERRAERRQQFFIFCLDMMIRCQSPPSSAAWQLVARLVRTRQIVVLVPSPSLCVDSKCCAAAVRADVPLYSRAQYSNTPMANGTFEPVTGGVASAARRIVSLRARPCRSSCATRIPAAA